MITASTMNSLISGLSFFMIPFVIGRAFLTLTDLLRKNKPKRLGDDLSAYTILGFFTSFMYGSILIFIVALFAHSRAFSPPLNTDFIQTFKIYSLVVLLASSAVLAIKFAAVLITRPKVNYRSLLLIVFFLALSVFIYFLWRWDSPPQTTLNWDLYEHQTVVNVMINEKRFSFTPLNISDTFQFDSYSTVFHTLLLLPQLLLKPDILGFWWFAEFFHLATTIAASYLIGYAFTKNRWVGIISSLFGAFIFESFVAYTSLFLLPQTVAATIAAAFISGIVIRSRNGEKITNLTTAVFVLYVLLIHLIVGFASVVIVSFSILYLNVFKKFMLNYAEQILLLIALAFLVLVPSITSNIAENYGLTDINRGEAQHFNLSLVEKVDQSRRFYGYSFAILFPLGLISVLNKKETELNLLTLLSIGVLGVVIASVPYTLKFYPLGRYLTQVVIALGFWAIIKDYGFKTKYAGIAILSLGLFVVFTLNIAEFKFTPSYKEISTHISPNEIKAAEFINANYLNSPVMIVGEPATMYILEGMSGVNSPGGSFTTAETRQILSDVYFSRDSTNMAEKLFRIKDGLTGTPEKILFVVSGRLSRWENAPKDYKMGIYWNVWTPNDLTLDDREFAGFISEFTNFKLVFSNDGVVIFEVERPS